jgi:hypothetical protein
VPRNPDCLVCSHLHRATDEQATDVSLDELASLGHVSVEEDEDER